MHIDSRMHIDKGARMAAVAVAAALAACGGSSGGPVFDYMAATPPLHYEVTRTSSTIVETPGGETGSDEAMSATVTLTLGDPVEGGREVTAVFKSLDLVVGSPMGEREFDGREVVDKPYAGVLHADGTITITDSPELKGELADLFDASSVLRDLLAPLPPAGSEDAVSWPHEYETAQSTVMDFVSSYAGTAAFAGDSTWGGHDTRVIVSKGDVSIKASGTPEGAPGEVEMTLAGPAETTYLWDPAVGVMRAAFSTAETKGEIMTMGFTLPAVTMVESTVLLDDVQD
jgi:hypothetical protein